MPTSQTQALIGYKTSIGIGIESTAGTAVAPTDYLYVTDATPTVKSNLVKRLIMRKTKGQNPSGPGIQEQSHSFTAEFNPGQIGLLLGLCMGVDTVTGSGPMYVHTFKLGSPLNTFTLSVDAGNGTTQQFAGNKVDQFTIQGKENEMLSLKASLKGIVNTPINSSLSPSYTAPEQPFDWIYIANPTINGNALNATDFSFDVKNNITAQPVSGSGRYAAQLNETMTEVTGSMSVQYVDESINTLIANATPVPIVVSFTHPVSSYALTITLPNCILSEGPITYKKSNTLMQAVKFSAFSSTNTSYDDITIALTNITSGSYVT